MSSYNRLIKDATKPKPGAPKAKYIDPIIAASFSSDGSLQDICKALANRLNDSNSLVVFRSLVVVHTLIRSGNVDNVLSYISTTQGNLRLRSVVNGGNWQGYDAPKMLGGYAAYLDERVRAFRELSHDVIRASDIARTQSRAGGSRARNASHGFDSAETGQRLRKLTVEKGLLREVHICQKVCSRLLDLFFSYFSDNPADELAATAFRMAIKDLFALYAAINEGVINVLEHYFEMAKSDAQQALDIYKRFCAQTEKIVAYMQTARRVSSQLNMNLPNLRHAPVSLAGALKEYLDDPNFEKNRLEYKESKRVADGGSRSAVAPTQTTPEKAKEPGSKSIKIQEPTAEEKARPVKPPTNDQAIQDFFESIDTNQNQMSMFGGGGNNGFMMPQATGMPPGIQGGLAPQMTGYNPFFFQQQQQSSGFMPPQQTGFIQTQPTGFGMPGQSYLQPQATGFNPFRQSTMMPQMTGMQPFGTGMGQGMQPAMPSAAQQTQQAQQSQAPNGSQISNESKSSAFDSFNSAFNSNVNGNAQTGTSTNQTNGTTSPVPKPLSAQKTGSRNPFAPPPGSTPPPMPTQNEKKGPSLYELAFGGANGTAGPTAGGGGSYGLGAGAWNGQQQQQQQQQQDGPSASFGIVPQKTGMIGSVASEFVTGNASSISFRNQTNPQSPAPSEQTGNQVHGSSINGTNGFGSNSGANDLASNFSALTVNGQAQSQQPLQPQPTGFGGSQVRPFKPESSFGQSLAANGGSAPSPIPAHLTGNPFARAGGTNAANGATAQSQPFGFGQSNANAAGQAGGTTSPAPQLTGFGASLFAPAQPSNGGASPGQVNSQPTGFSSSLFGAGSIGQPSSPSPFQSQPQQQVAPQPTGFGGSNIRPFQPQSAFGSAAFGSLGGQQQPQRQQQQQIQQPQQPNQQQMPFQTSVPTGSFF